MRRFLLASLLLLAAFGCSRRDANRADIVLVNARIHTLSGDINHTEPDATALAVRGDEIVYVGGDDGAQAWVGEGTRRIDLAGAAVLPGLVDAHAHLADLGHLLREVSLFGTPSSEDVRRLVMAAVASAPAGTWVRGRGWDQNDWAEKAFPGWRDLAGTESHPVVLERVDGHAYWLNQTALSACGITRDTRDPAGGRIVRDASGEPTGILVDEAQELVETQLPEPGPAEMDTSLARATRECVRLGLTGVHDAGTTRAELDALRRLAEAGRLPINVYVMLDSDEPGLVSEQFARGPAEEFGGRIVIRALKLRADGALGSRGAALLADYSDDAGNRGLDVDAADSLFAGTQAALRHGFQVATHAIGDRGNRTILDLYERALAEANARNARLRVEHCQVLSPDDIPRFAALGVVASMQPTHATSDMPWAETRVGPERLAGAYAWRTLMQSGATLAFGSDFPVESANPLLGLYAAVTRQDAAGNPEGGWRAAEALTLDEAVRAFTQGSAWAAFDEARGGTIAIGRRADLTILERDPYQLPASALLDLRVRATVVRGAVVYEATR